MGYFKKNKISAFYYFGSAQFIHYEFSFAQLSKFNKYRSDEIKIYINKWFSYAYYI